MLIIILINTIISLIVGYKLGVHSTQTYQMYRLLNAGAESQIQSYRRNETTIQLSPSFSNRINNTTIQPSQ